MKSIAFIGLGTMGMPMAANLLKQGYSLTVYNRTAAKAEDLIRQGARQAETPADAARSADVLFTNVSHDAALLEVILGENGVLEGAHPGLTVIDCSTVAPETSRQVAERLAECSAEFLDAPVTGSKPAAESGTLTFMVGGKAEVLNAHRDLFDTLGSRLVHMGPTGSGSYTKLAHNTIVGINAAALMEGMSFAVKAGLDPEKFLEIVLAGAAASRQAELKGRKIIERDFSVQFSLQLMLKDLLLAARETERFQLPSPMLHSATDLFQMGNSKGLAEQDLCSAVLCYEEWNHEPLIKHSPESGNDGTGGTGILPGAAGSFEERRSAERVPLDIDMKITVHQWELEGSFSGQTIEGKLLDMSEKGLQFVSESPLAEEMFVVLYFPMDSDLPPITGKIIRIDSNDGIYTYGCLLTGLSPVTKVNLERYIHSQKR